jgi:hypothetical protein
MVFGEEGYGRINGGTTMVELVADKWKAALASRRQLCEF